MLPSEKPLIKKLGIKPHMTITFINLPPGYEKILGKLPYPTFIALLDEGMFDFIQCFSESAAELQILFPILKKHLKVTGSLWISWPNKQSGVKTDLTEDRIRALGLTSGIVDVKVVAIDKVWSGLKFVYRQKDR